MAHPRQYKQAGRDAPRVVITGVGVVSPIGIGNDSFWRNLVAGRSGIGFLRTFPSRELPSNWLPKSSISTRSSTSSTRNSLKLCPAISSWVSRPHRCP